MPSPVAKQNPSQNRLSKNQSGISMVNANIAFILFFTIEFIPQFVNFI